MNELNNTLFKLLRSVLCDEMPSKSVLEELDSEKIEKLYIMAKRHDMAHLIGAAIDKCGVKVEGEISQKLASAQMLAVFRYENLNYELLRIKNTLEEGEIDYIPLKGSVIRDLYPEPWMRTSSDIDILVRESDHKRATKLICGRLGYTLKEKESKHDVSLYSESGVHLELHFSICEDIDMADPYLAKVWEYASIVGVGHEYKMNNEFLVFYLIIHILCHFAIGGCGIRPICDLYFCKHKLCYDEAAVIEFCRAAHTETFYKELMLLAELWLGNAQCSELSESLEGYIFSGGVFGTTASHITVRRTVDRGGARYAARRIFAPYATLKKRYPSLNSRALVPIYQVRRWIDVIRQGRGEASLKELKTNAAIDSERLDGINALMKDLGIKEHIK